MEDVDLIIMFDQATDAHIESVIEQYFSTDERLLELAPGDVLMREGEFNDKVYYVRSGQLVGTIGTGNHRPAETLRAGAGDMVGVQSFFSGSHTSTFTIAAVEPTTLVWIDRETWPEDEISIERRLMPVVVAELTRRQQVVREMAAQRRTEEEKVEKLERNSFLGQLAAGVAHELNNALTVLVRGTEWVGQAVESHLVHAKPLLQKAFEHGLREGRAVSSAEARDRIADLRARFGLSYAEARKVAQTGMPDGMLFEVRQRKGEFEEVVAMWELGATLNDMRLSSAQAEHVVASMKNLGARQSLRDEPVDVNHSIHVALQILRNAMRGIEVSTRFGDLPSIRGNRGEFVQVWSNLVKNACEALNGASAEMADPPRITLTTTLIGPDITVTIDDNGPGIPEHILPRLFEPSVTTKKKGLEFGLGLGLSIVQRLVTDYGGEVRASNTDHGARFTVTLPTGGV